MRSGRFTNLRPLTKGGMGALYLASETIATGTRKVVIKEMLDYYDSNDPQAQTKAQHRFEAEAITLANLSIPGIPQIFDYFSEGGRNYIVMQFIEGKNLESSLTHVDESGKLVRGKSYALEQVRRWGMDVCRMLDSLASLNVIHMDIKPANLILDPSGAVWLVDFGTAKGSGSGVIPSKATIVPNPKQSAGGGGMTSLNKSSVYGTLGYAAPEQVGGKAEPRSDVFALAATLYHLATDDDPGRHPAKFPQLDRLPADFGSALKRALALDVRQRISAREFASALEPRSTTRSLGFHWKDGAVTQDPADLAAAADLRWEEARGYFSGPSWENWLQDIHRNDLASRIAQIKKQITDVDMGLDAFLRSLNANYPAAKLYVPNKAIDAGTIPWGTQKVLNLEIQNQGSGALYAQLLNLPAGLRAAQAAVAVHRKHTLTLVVDSSMLRPSLRSQTIPLVINAGSAGLARIQIQLIVPAPVMTIDPASLDFGVAFRGQVIEVALIVRNPGSSNFRCEVSSQMLGLMAAPGRFDCPPGGEQPVNFELDTHPYGIGLHTSSISFKAQAGGWEQIEGIPTQLHISLLRSIWNIAGPALYWGAGIGVYGSFLGWFLVSLAVGIDEEISTLAWGGVVGGFPGCVGLSFPCPGHGCNWLVGRASRPSRVALGCGNRYR